MMLYCIRVLDDHQYYIVASDYQSAIALATIPMARRNDSVDRIASVTLVSVDVIVEGAPK